MSRRIPLADLAAEITTTRWEDGETTQTLMLGSCPVCREHADLHDHAHAIPFRPGGGKTRGGRNVWSHTGGSTIADLTLSPSYLAGRGGGGPCVVHLFVRDGHVELLDDSRRTP